MATSNYIHYVTNNCDIYINVETKFFNTSYICISFRIKKTINNLTYYSWMEDISTFAIEERTMNNTNNYVEFIKSLIVNKQIQIEFKQLTNSFILSFIHLNKIYTFELTVPMMCISSSDDDEDY